MIEVPKISVSAVSYPDGIRYRLYVTSYGQTMPAGERLFRSPPFPTIKFIHNDESSAMKDAQELQKYIDQEWAKKQPSKDRTRANAVDVKPEITNAVWM